MLNEIDDILVVDHTEGFNFCVNKSLEVFVPLENLHGIPFALWVLCHLDLAACADAKSLADAQFFEERRWLGFFYDFFEGAGAGSGCIT